jgi:DNA-binding GntR family transcriptional regulator
MQLHWQHLRRSMGEVLQRPRFTQQVWREHGAILDAMADGDAELAARLIGEHVGVAHARVREELAAHPQSAMRPVGRKAA